MLRGIDTGADARRYDPIQLLAPQDCVASINDIVDKMDHLVSINAQSGIEKLKEIFGLEALKDIRDFAQTIAFPLGGPFDCESDAEHGQRRG